MISSFFYAVYCLGIGLAAGAIPFVGAIRWDVPYGIISFPSLGGCIRAWIIEYILMCTVSRLLVFVKGRGTLGEFYTCCQQEHGDYVSIDLLLNS